MLVVRNGSGVIEVADRSIELSNYDKQLYPADGFTKGDVAEYYRSVAGVMVPHLRAAPLALRRFPDGVAAGGFFQKEASEHFPGWVRVEPVPQRGGDAPVHHTVCDDAATLVYLAGQACLEFHVWLSTMDDLERPRLLVIDLDPPADRDLSELRSVTKRMCQRLRDEGLVPHVQATGGKGFHVVAPLNEGEDFDAVRARAREIAGAAQADDPRRLTTAQRKDQRGGRIFLDTNRNAYGQTMIAPYSLRARDGAPAATPLDPSEISRARPDGFGLATVRRRLARKGDPWSDLL